MNTRSGENSDDTREATRASQHTKTARTRQAILEAVTELSAENHASAADVTVSSIVRRAGISRSAFYTHYSGVEDLAVAILRGVFDRIGDADLEWRRQPAVSGREAASRAQTLAITHMLDHRPLYLVAFDLAHSSAAWDLAVEEFAVHVRKTMDVVAEVPAGLDRDEVASYVASGSMSLILSWLRAETPPPVATMSAKLLALTPAWLTAAD